MDKHIDYTYKRRFVKNGTIINIDRTVNRFEDLEELRKEGVHLELDYRDAEDVFPGKRVLVEEKAGKNMIEVLYVATDADDQIINCRRLKAEGYKPIIDSFGVYMYGE